MRSKIYLVEAARHAAPVGGVDTAADARRVVDEQRAERAVRLLSGLDTPEARLMYAELHRAGALYPQRQPSIPFASRLLAVA